MGESMGRSSWTMGHSSDYKFLMSSLFLYCCQEKPV